MGVDESRPLAGGCIDHHGILGSRNLSNLLAGDPVDSGLSDEATVGNAFAGVVESIVASPDNGLPGGSQGEVLLNLKGSDHIAEAALVLPGSDGNPFGELRSWLDRSTGRLTLLVIPGRLTGRDGNTQSEKGEMQRSSESKKCRHVQRIDHGKRVADSVTMVGLTSDRIVRLMIGRKERGSRQKRPFLLIARRRFCR